MNNKQKLEDLIDKMLEGHKKKMQYAESIGKLEKEIYFHEGSISALEAVRIQLDR